MIDLTCPSCGHAVRETARFCDSCGTALSSSNAQTWRLSLDLASTLPATRSLTGRVLEGKYELRVRLGEGGMGTVYQARRMRIEDEVAIKIMRPEYVKNNTALERFRREAQTAAGLHHPNIVVIHDFGETSDPDIPAFIVMELLTGESLRDVLKRDIRLEPHRAISLMREVCAGVAAAHHAGILHRDLKPENVMVLPPYADSKPEMVKVVDFGLARLRGVEADTRLTQAGALLGTPCYMSPEQCRGEELDSRSDVYSLAGLLYEMLSGEHPFMASSNAEIISKHLLQLPAPLPASLGVSPSIEDIIMRGLAKDPQARQEDAESFSQELKVAVGSEASLVIAYKSADRLADGSDEKGVLDYQAEIEEAFEEMTRIIVIIGEENEKIGRKAAAHAVHMQALNINPPSGAAGQKRKIALVVASDMNLCARRFEDELPSLANCTEIIHEGISGLSKLLTGAPSDKPESLIRSRSILAQFSTTAMNGTNSLRDLRNVVAGMAVMSKDVNRASRRLAGAIDGIIQNFERVEAFAVKAISLIDRFLE